MSSPSAGPADLVPAGSRARGGEGVLERSARRRLLADSAARWVVGAGGIAVIVSILGILAFLVLEVMPLTTAARVEPGRRVARAGPLPDALLVDEHRTHVAALGEDGVVRVRRLDGAGIAAERRVSEVPLVGARAGDGAFVAGTRDGRVLRVPVEFRVGFEGSERVVTPQVGEPLAVQVDPEARPLEAFAGVASDGGGFTAVAQLADGRLAVVSRTVQENFFTGETTETLARGEVETPAPARQLLLDARRSDLYAITRDGRLLWWRLDGAEAAPPRQLSVGTSEVTAMTLLIGERSLVVGRGDGSLDVWAQVQGATGQIEPAHLSSLPAQDAPIRWVVASGRNRSFLAQDEAGGLGLYYSTSQRTLWRGEGEPARTAAYAPKGDAVVLADADALREWVVENPHPEASLRTFFEKVWYEGYAAPEWVWQSTGGSDDFESKLSLTPLLFGTFKATVYSLALAVPLAVLAAIYTAQFMHPRLAKVVKPTIEIMASLPSVVLGFLAGLWLAPRLEGAFPGLMLVFVVVPVTAVLAGFAWNALPLRIRGRLRDGTEVLWHAVALVGALVLCFQLNGPVEAWLFGGSFPQWLLDRTGLTYEQRNAMVVGIAMGFAVIPIIFAISEDALSNVPRDLVAGSLALGADRWQTVVRVVLPTASPGIFSAVMVGFGRAIGETMIVLMATGNTPIMDWSPFNGFRTLSANIAVEIPEAPVGSTLYRTLFLAAILLFAITFLVNTAAELVRQTLRNRYARL